MYLNPTTAQIFIDGYKHVLSMIHSLEGLKRSGSPNDRLVAARTRLAREPFLLDQALETLENRRGIEVDEDVVSAIGSQEWPGPSSRPCRPKASPSSSDLPGNAETGSCASVYANTSQCPPLSGPTRRAWPDSSSFSNCFLIALSVRTKAMASFALVISGLAFSKTRIFWELFWAPFWELPSASSNWVNGAVRAGRAVARTGPAPDPSLGAGCSRAFDIGFRIRPL